jgi:hypothetical protein
MYTQDVALIIPNGVKQNGSDCFEIIDPDAGGRETFSVPLRTKGTTGGATHWGANTPLLQTSYEALRDMSTNQFKDYVNSLKPGKSVASAAFKNSLLMGEPGGNFWAFVDANNLEPVPA